MKITKKQLPQLIEKKECKNSQAFLFSSTTKSSPQSN